MEMAGDIGDVVKKLERLTLIPDEDRSNFLQEISPVLALNAGNSDFRKRLIEANLESLFECFQIRSEKDEDIEIVGEILLKVSSYFKEGELLQKYPKAFKRGLEHENSAVQEAHLRVVKACLETPSGKEIFLNNAQALRLVLDCLKEKELAVAKHVMDILINLGQENAVGNIPMLDNPTCIQFLTEAVQDKNEVVRLRVFDIMVKVAKRSQSSLDKVAQTGFLHKICDEVKSDDILLQLNALELLTELAEKNHGLRFLDEAKVIPQLEEALDLITASPMANILMPGVIKLFGVVAKNHREDALQMYPKFKDTLCSMLSDSNDASGQVLAIQTIAHICCNPPKKLEVANKNKYGELVRAFFQRINPMIKSGNTESRVHGLSALSDLCRVHHEEASEKMADEMSVNESLFDMFDDKPLTLVATYAKLPIPEVCSEAYKLILALSNQPWALKRFVNHPGFIEFLLDRTTVTDKELTEAKFTIIKNASEHENLLPENIVKRLKKYVTEGPFYSTASVEIAYDDMS